MTDNPFALFWAWTEPHSAAGAMAGITTEERPVKAVSDKGGTRPEPELAARVVPFRREP